VTHRAPGFFARTLYTLAVMVFLATMVFLSYLALVLFTPRRGIDTFTVKSVDKVVVQGHIYRWTVSYCVADDVPLPVMIDREIELQNHKIRFPLSVIQYTITERCETFTRAFALPYDTPPGVYHLHIHTSIEYHPLRIVRQEWQGDEFQVVPFVEPSQGVQGVQGTQGTPGKMGESKK